MPIAWQVRVLPNELPDLCEKVENLKGKVMKHFIYKKENINVYHNYESVVRQPRPVSLPLLLDKILCRLNYAQVTWADALLPHRFSSRTIMNPSIQFVEQIPQNLYLRRHQWSVMLHGLVAHRGSQSQRRYMFLLCSSRLTG